MVFGSYMYFLIYLEYKFLIGCIYLKYNKN